MALNFFWNAYKSVLKRIQYDLGITFVHEKVAKLDLLDEIHFDQNHNLNDPYLHKLLVQYFENDLHLSLLDLNNSYEEIYGLKEILRQVKKKVGFDGLSLTEIAPVIPRDRIELRLDSKDTSNKRFDGIYSFDSYKSVDAFFSDIQTKKALVTSNGLFVNSVLISTLLLRSPWVLEECSEHIQNFIVLVLPIRSRSLKETLVPRIHYDPQLSIMVHDDSQVRKILHSYGFYEVDSFAHGMKLVKQSVVEYSHDFRIKKEEPLISNDDVTMCLYLATRKPTDEA